MTDAAVLAGRFRALAHPTRLLILDDLRDGMRRSPKELAARIGGGATVPQVAHHTRELARTRLLARAGTHRGPGAVQHFYRISPTGRSLLGLVDRLEREA